MSYKIGIQAETNQNKHIYTKGNNHKIKLVLNLEELIIIINEITHNSNNIIIVNSFVNDMVLGLS